MRSTMRDTVLHFIEEEAAFGAPVTASALVEMYEVEPHLIDNALQTLVKEGKIREVAPKVYELRPEDDND